MLTMSAPILSKIQSDFTRIDGLYQRYVIAVEGADRIIGQHTDAPALRYWAAKSRELWYNVEIHKKDADERKTTLEFAKYCRHIQRIIKNVTQMLENTDLRTLEQEEYLLLAKMKEAATICQEAIPDYLFEQERVYLAQKKAPPERSSAELSEKEQPPHERIEGWLEDLNSFIITAYELIQKYSSANHAALKQGNEAQKKIWVFERETKEILPRQKYELGEYEKDIIRFGVQEMARLFEEIKKGEYREITKEEIMSLEEMQKIQARFSKNHHHTNNKRR